ncbi:hypothetical protein NL676_019637 [Syzygium grande]|nr:hypothetical protein NL676_019637 [Syzygium grande]
MALALLFLVLVLMFATSASQKQMNRGNGYSLGVFLAGIPLQTVSWLPGQFTDVAVPAESAISASMLDSGNFVLYDSNRGIIWQTFDSPTDSLLPGQNLSAGHQLVSSASESDQSSGVFRIKVQHDDDLCSPKGICGLNMYCVTIDLKVSCVCLPGFAPVQEGNWMSGCERNFTQESCKRTGENADYTIQPIANTVWEDDSYSVQQLPTIEECRATCLPDCNCAVVIYNNGVCKKQGLPLRFGRRDRANSNTVSIKLSTATSDANAPKRIKSRSGLTFWSLSGHQMYLEHGVSIGSIEDVGPRLFTYEELKEVTKDFKDEIGKGRSEHRRSLDFCRSEDKAVLEECVYGCFQAGELAKLVDSEEVETKQLERVVKIGLWCVLEEPSLRPSMRKVLLMLEGTVDIPVPPSPTSFLSST